MRDATVDRLSKIVMDPPQGGSGKDNRFLRRPQIQLHLSLAEGWFSLFLLALVVYSTVWSVQAAQWVNNTNVLTLTTALGLLCGVVASKQRRVPRVLVHIGAVAFGLLLAVWQTTGADYSGNFSLFYRSLHNWVLLALAGGTSSDDSIFLLLITALGFLLAYTSAWLVYRTRAPWLMILANAFVLLINLSNIEPGYIVFLIIFLVAALLLLLRFNLYESSLRWKRLGLRCSDDLGWEFMQAGALISIGILIFSWLLPWGYTDANASQIWSADSNPWVQLQNTWNRLVAVSGGSNPANHGNFTDTLVLGGNPNLTNTVVFRVKTTDSTQYLQSLSYDNYDGRGWGNGPQVITDNKANTIVYDGASLLRPVTQIVYVVNPPGEQRPYLLGAAQIASSDQAAQIVSNRNDGVVVAWLRQNGKLAAGNQYTVTSYVSNADVQSLRTVPLPTNSQPLPPNYDGPLPTGYYDPAILRTYMQLPPNLDTNIREMAKRLTLNANTMYDKAVALETYLRTNYTYDANISLPPGEEGVSWFLFRSNHRGFCNYFATTMTIMARELGIPARVAVGYTNGKIDPKTGQSVIYGTDAHAWTQIYFAGYGWVNFEPSASFSTFTRPLVAPSGTPNFNPGGTTLPGSAGQNGNNHNHLPNETGGNNTGLSSTGGNDGQNTLRNDIGITLLALLLLIVGGLLFFGFWWRRLFHGLSLPAQIYGRVCLMANWAGISLLRSQTPFESMQALATAAPEEAITLERLGDIYVRERWSDPANPDHPRRTGEVGELPGLWKRLQPRLFFFVLRHPHFLREIPGVFTRRLRRLLRRKDSSSPVIVEERTV